MKILKILSLSVLLISFYACDININMKSISGNGNVISEERHIAENISSVKVSSGIQLELIEGETQSVIVEADENLHEHISTSIENGELKIRVENGFIKKADSKKVIVTYTALDAITASSGSKVKSKNPVIADQLYIQVSSGASVKLHVLAKDLSVKTSSGSDADLNGNSKSIEVKASSGSSIDAKELEAMYATAKASSGASIKLFITEELNANASSGGLISYDGSPKQVNKNKSSSGSVQKM